MVIKLLTMLCNTVTVINTATATYYFVNFSKKIFVSSSVKGLIFIVTINE